MGETLAVARRPGERHGLLAMISIAALMGALCLVFDPRWETNDDVAMSMVAHGYGLATYSSPLLVFSNVMWGAIARSIPAIHGVLGYSIASMAVLFVSGWAMLYFLLRLGAGYLLSMLCLALLLPRPILFPQFTLNAGLLTAAAIIGWRAYVRCGRGGMLVAASLLAFLGYLVRSREFFLVLGVALPLLPWDGFRRLRKMQASALVLGLAIASAAALDRCSYRGAEWKQFLALHRARALYTDFRAGEVLKEHPEIMTRHGFSENDVELIEQWFFVDPQLADPQPLYAMLAEIGPRPMRAARIKTGGAALGTLIAPVLLPLLVPAILLFTFAPRWSVALAWMSCLAAVFAVGAMGRLGVVRVYVPPMCLLVVAPLVVGNVKQTLRRLLAASTLIVALAWNAFLLIPEASASKKTMAQIRRDLGELPADSIVCWGGNFPFESAFPVLSRDPLPRAIRIYPLGVLTHAPFSVATAEVKVGRGMIDRLRSPEGVPIVATKHRMDRLGLYCQERLKGRLRTEVVHQTPSLTIRKAWCGGTE
ncbi:MAG: hypothetical protein HYX75_25155 [Acidobacteria bacterium]|nr:hypothetical protein [Acidobacteriota bacterium]